MGCSMYRHMHHQRIAALLARLDPAILAQTECLFAGGTAIAMQLDEFRRSDDIDFLCASVAGYRQLRETVFDKGLGALARERLPVLRDVRADQYGIRTVLGDAAHPVKFEIVREARIMLSSSTEQLVGVPLLNREDFYAEKLLANADRGRDSSTLHRDLIDLCVMIHRWGPIPPSALRKARGAYGDSIDRALQGVAAMLRKRGTLKRCLDTLDAEAGVQAEVETVLASFSRE